MEGNSGALAAAQLNENEEYASALDAIERAIDREGLTAELDLLRGDAFVGLERFRDANGIARSLVQDGGDKVRAAALLLSARVYRRSSRYVETALVFALDAARSAEREGARAIAGAARLEAARLFSRKRCQALAERELARAAETLGADDPRIGYHSSAVRIDFDDRPGARRDLLAIVDRGAIGRSLGVAGLAHLELVMGEFDAAHAHLDSLAPLPSGALWPRRIRAQIFSAQQKWKEAADALADVIAASPSADSVWRDSHDRAISVYRAGEPEEAKELCRELVEAAPEDDYWAQQASRTLRLLEHPEVATRRRCRLKEFPSVTQLRDHCGPASCELYLRYFGLSRDQIDIAREIKNANGGTPVYRMRRYLESAGFVARRLEADLDHVRRFIDAGFPVIMEESYSSSSHVAVAIGYDDAREVLEVQDPMTHQVRETYYEDLTELRNLSNHGSLVAAPASDPAKVAALDAVGPADCRYMTLVDEAWAASDDGRPGDGDRLVDESIELHRAYELAWFYRFRRARERAGAEPTADNRVALHRVLGEITALWPDDEWPQQMLGQVLYFDSRPREALVAFERARDRDGADPYNWSMIADCQLALGDNAAAYDALVEALARDPSFVRANENLADLAQQRGEMTMAWELNDAARELAPANYFNHAVHGELLERARSNEEAVAAFDRALEIEPGRGWVTLRKGRLLARMGRIGEAVACLRSLVDRSPESIDARIDLADLLYSHDRLHDAIAECEHIVRLDAEVAAGHAIMGAALGKLGDLSGALAKLDRALELRPVYSWVYTHKGRLLMEGGRAREAIGSFAAALGMSDRSSQCEYELGDALVKAGYPREGVRNLRRAAVHGELTEQQLSRIGELIVDTESGNADQFFGEVSEHRRDDLAVMRAHARTMLEVLWAPAAGAKVIERIRAVAPGDPYALAARGEELALRSVGDEALGEKLMRDALAGEPSLGYGRRVLAGFLVDRGRFAEALELLGQGTRNFHNDKLRVRAHLGLGDYAAAEQAVAAFSTRWDIGGEPGVGALQLSYLIARRRWDWKEALRLAEAISHKMHERDDDGRLDRWEQDRFECMARLGEVDRALRFGEAQAVDADSLGRLAYTAYRVHQLPLGAELARRALRLDPDEVESIAVVAHVKELEGDVDGSVATWHRLGELAADWHVWQEQLARIAIGRGQLDAARELAEAAVGGGHLCPWSFATRAQVLACAGERDAALNDLERAWAIAAPELRDNEAKDVWAWRDALRGREDDARRLLAQYLAEPGLTANDRDRIARVRAALALG